MPNTTAAILGATHPHASHHLASLQASPHVNKIAVFDPDKGAARSMIERDETKIANLHDELGALFRDESVHFAIANMRNDQNAAVCEQALRAGVHVLSEKPIAINAAEVARVANLAKETGLKLGVMYTNRYSAPVQEMRRCVQDGVLGRITGCEARVITSQVQFRDPTHWLFDVKKSGGGILSWLGCHYLDMLRFVTGDEVTCVFAHTATLSGEAISVEDVAAVSLRFRSGAVASLHAGYELPFSAAGYSSAAYDSFFAIRGTDGVAWQSSKKPGSLSVQSKHPAWHAAPQRTFEYVPIDTDNPKGYGGAAGLDFLDRFIASTRGNGDPPATGDDALAVARIVEAAYESNQSGRSVEL